MVSLDDLVPAEDRYRQIEPLTGWRAVRASAALLRRSGPALSRPGRARQAVTGRCGRGRGLRRCARRWAWPPTASRSALYRYGADRATAVPHGRSTTPSARALRAARYSSSYLPRCAHTRPPQRSPSRHPRLGDALGNGPVRAQPDAGPDRRLPWRRTGAPAAGSSVGRLLSSPRTRRAGGGSAGATCGGTADEVAKEP